MPGIGLIRKHKVNLKNLFSTVCISLVISACVLTPERYPQMSNPMFTTKSISALKFLEGRWSGKAPDGSEFFEEYDFPDASTMRSRRYSDGSFTKVSDGSTVSLKDGKITSTWGEFTWEAVSIETGVASFRPLNAPSAFSWKRINADSVEVTQNWSDEKGQPQSYSLTLNRKG